MNLCSESNDINDYLVSSEVIDFEHPEVQTVARELAQSAGSDGEFARSAYEFVRDRISHSLDIVGKTVTCRASDVLQRKEGICWAKSHLLAAILRAQGIPAGFCYQVLASGSETTPWRFLHGLNGIYLKGTGKWIRVDARGNKPGIDAQFSVDEERLAFEIDKRRGGKDYPVVFTNPNESVLQALQSSRTMEELKTNVPEDL